MPSVKDRDIWLISVTISAKVGIRKKIEEGSSQGQRQGLRGAQDFGSQPGYILIIVSVKVFIEVVVLLEVVVGVEVVVLVVEVVDLVVEVVVLQIRADEKANIPSFFAFEAYHAPQSVCANDDAPENISSIVVTLDTSHLEISPLNDGAKENMYAMLVTPDTSHLERSPLNDDAE